MMHFDSLRLRVPQRAVLWFKQEGARQFLSTMPGKPNRVTYVHKSIAPGLNEVKLDLNTGDVIISLSSKILGKDYPKLISQRTIHTVLMRLNSSCLILLRPDVFFKSTTVLKADITADIRPHCIQDSLSALSLLAHHRFHWHRYPRLGSVEFLEKGGKGRRLIIYNKGQEIKLPRNDKFFEVHKGEIQPNVFDGILRFEVRLATVKAIRKAVQCGKVCWLAELLASQDHPILDLLYEILQAGVVGPSIYVNLNKEGLSFAEYIKILGRQTFVVKELEGKTDKIDSVVKSCCSSSTAKRHIRDIKKAVRWQRHPDNELIREVLDLLIEHFK